MSQFRRVYALIRHGDYQQQPQAPSAHQPHGLTEKGFKQSRQAATTIQSFLQEQQLTLAPFVHASPLRRAWETAHQLCSALSLAEIDNCIISSDDLTERSVGSLANLTVEEIEAIIADDPRFEALPSDWKSDSYYCLPVPGAESLLQAGGRVARYLQHLESLPRSQNELILIVGHGAAIRHAAYHLGILEFEEIAKLSMFHVEPVFIEQKKYSWQRVGGEWKVRDQQDQYTD